MTVTVTTKNQITLPISFVRKLNIKMGEKLIVEEKAGVISFRKYDDLLDQYQGFLKPHKSLRSKNLDEMIVVAKKERFAKKI